MNQWRDTLLLTVNCVDTILGAIKQQLQQMFLRFVCDEYHTRYHSSVLQNPAIQLIDTKSLRCGFNLIKC